MLVTKNNKCAHCGTFNRRESESCFNCNKGLEPPASIYGRSAVRQVRSTKRSFLSFKLGATTAITMTLVILALVISTVYLNSVTDKTSKVSLMTQYYWMIEPPGKKILTEAVSAAVVREPDANGKVIQEPLLKYKKDCEDLRPCQPNAPMIIDRDHSRATLVESEMVELKDYFVISSRVDKVKANAGKPGFIRYTAKVDADINRITVVKEQEFKTGKDGSTQKRESSKIEITLKWNPAGSQWEMP